jgi:outer membrane protein TolC
VVLNAGSEVRVAYGAYRTAFDIAEHYQDQVLPMQETLLEEANYNYNGMIIGVFELLQTGTAKASAEINAITAKQNTLAAAINLYSVLAGNQSDMEFDTISASETRQDKGH